MDRPVPLAGESSVAKMLGQARSKHIKYNRGANSFVLDKRGGEVIWTKSKRTAFFFGKLSHRVTHRQTPHEYSQYPWLANLGYNSVRRLNITYNCAGSLIGDRFLTNLSVIGDGNK